MKIKNVYKFAGLMVLYVVLQSRAGGPGSQQDLQVTGAPGSTGSPGTCANSTCHTQGSFNPTISMSLFENGNLVAKWQPGKDYTLKFTNSAIQGTPQRFGFQAVALNATNQQAGNWGTPGAGKQVVTLSSRKYMEHSAPSTSGIFELPWTAPAAGVGTVTFYVASVAANNNNNPLGDGTAVKTLVLEEDGPSNVSNLVQEYASMKVLPNPVGDMLNLEIVNRSPGNYKLRFIKTSGEVAKIEPISLTSGLNNASFGVDELAPGLYILQLFGSGQHVAATQMLKR